MAINIFKQNNVRIGLILGLLLPVVGIFLFYYWKIYPNSFGTFMQYLRQEKRLLSNLTVVSLLLNVALFTWYVNTQRDQSAKGVFAMTLVYGIFSLLFKFFG